MNSIDPSLAKYLSTSKQDILDTYHGKKSKGSEKRKKDPQNNGLLINDSNDVGWGNNALDDDDDGAPGGLHAFICFFGSVCANETRLLVVEHRITSVFKPIASTSKTPKPEQVEDPTPLDEAPLVVGSVIQEAPPSGRISALAPKRLQGGLQTAAQLREENKIRKAAVEAEKLAARATAAAQKSASGEGGEAEGQEDTVYRDKSGKRIDTKAEKAEIARQKRDELQKEMQKMEWGKGLVQREDREKRQREIENMANKPMARYADDEEMNDELKEKGRWNDPAARFLEDSGKKSKKGKVPHKPKYTGPMPPPNRFAIPPGYRQAYFISKQFPLSYSHVMRIDCRYDGVDRSNGFERQLMQVSCISFIESRNKWKGCTDALRLKAGNKRKIQDAAARVFSTEDM